MHQTLRDDDRVMSLVEMALARPQAERLAYIAEMCGDDIALLRQVREYLVWEEQMDGFLLEPLYRRGAPERPFESGMVLESRFRIVREVAQGGMGIVYEATDERLGRRIALKCAKAGFGKRLPPEVLHASKISHPNVCKIFEIHTAATPHGDIDFVTMEFLDGETLAERLKKGRPGRDEARRTAIQICAGLAEAHRRQVVHGDLKTNNIIVTEEPGGTGSTRAVITDFGLARPPGESRGGVQSGPLAGTPSYMAPELWRGQKPGIASDIYALGVVLRELGTDKTAGSGWDRTVQRCLETDPDRRFPDATAVAQALAPRALPWVAGVAAALLATLSGLVTYRIATAPEEQVRLALLPLETVGSTSGLPSWLSKAVSERLSHLRPGEHTSVQLSDERNASHFLRAALTPMAGGVGVRVVLTDGKTQATRTEWKAVYEHNEVRHLPTAIAGIVTASFHIPALSPAPMVNAAAQQDYQSGILLLKKNSTVDAAIPLLERAVSADQDSALTHAALAEGRYWKYFMTRKDVWRSGAAESVRRAELRNPDLPEVHRISGWLKADAGWYDQAVASYLRAIELNPNDDDAYRRLGQAYERSSRHDEALAAFRHAADAEPTDYRNHQSLGSYFNARAKYDEAVVHFRKAVELAPGEPVAHFALGRGYMGAGKFTEAEAALREALLHGETPEALNTLGAVLMYREKDAEAVSLFERALLVYGENYLWRLNLGVALRRLNQITGAEIANRQALKVAEVELRKDPRKGYVRSCVAYLSAWLGDRERAVTEVEQALRLAPSDSDTLRMAVKVWEALGEREQSLTVLRASPPEVVADLARYPDLADLHKDSRFQQLAGQLTARRE